MKDEGTGMTREGLTGNQRRYLRALGHHLDPVVRVGHAGVTEAVGRALDRALLDHELVKVKLAPAGGDADETAAELARMTGSDCAQVLGHTALLYRRREENPRIELPGPRTRPARPTPRDAKRAARPPPRKNGESRAPRVARNPRHAGRPGAGKADARRRGGR